MLCMSFDAVAYTFSEEAKGVELEVLCKTITCYSLINCTLRLLPGPHQNLSNQQSKTTDLLSSTTTRIASFIASSNSLSFITFLASAPPAAAAIPP